MKAAIVGLSVATVAFAGSSLYLGRQLAAEREHAAQVEKATQELNARIAELEKMRNAFAQPRLANAPGFMSGSISSGESVAMPATAPSTAPKAGEPEQPVWTVRRHEPSPAMQKMMRKQMRATNKRIYADVGRQLLLDDDTTNKLIDLLTEQQAAGMNFAMPGEDPAEVTSRFEQTQRDQEMALNDLIGPDKVYALREYQKTIPARMEVESLVRQLENNEVPVSAEQQRKLVDVYIEERARIPFPTPYEGIDPEAFGKSMRDWQEDYETRVAAEASRILEPAQLAAYNEIQQWQKEMRAQIQVQMPMAPTGAVPLRRGMAGNTVFATAVPAGAVSVTVENAPSPPQERKAH